MKAINWIMFALALIALVFCALSGYQYLTFSPEEYDAQVTRLDADTARVRQDIIDMQAELEARDAAVRSDLAQAGEKGAAAGTRLSAAEQANAAKKEELASLREQIVFTENIYDNTLALRDEYAGKIRQLEDLIIAGQSDVKICYWSFDDGPGAMTNAILDYCSENGLYVTFFTSREANKTDNNDADEPAVLRREAMGGHSVQNHTYSHQYAQYGNVYGMGIDSFREVVRQQDEWIYENTGFKADIFRFPGGSAWAFNHLDKQSMLTVLEEMGYKWIDWSCDVMDNLVSNPDASTVYSRAMWQIPNSGCNIAVVLSHDWNFNTYYGFIRAVPELQKKGYVFLPLFSQSWAIGNITVKFS